MNLKNLALRDNIVIQCHDIPDADAIGAGFALQQYLKTLGAGARLVYGGRADITKPNLLMLIAILGIEIERVGEIPADSYIVTVDCQYGAGNVQKFPCADFAVIDHHIAEIPEGGSVLIAPALASCSTLMWDLMRAQGYDFASDYRVRNALYYGLFTDTNGLSELRHPLDRDLADIRYDPALIKKLKNSALTLDELNIVSRAMRRYEIIENIGLFRADPCDPNILGFVSDIAMQVQHLDCCVVYCETPFGVKLSVRSSAREIMSSEIAAFLCAGVGSGGGGLEKAGGFIGFDKSGKIPGETDSAAFLKERVLRYIGHFDLIYAENNSIDFSGMKLYKKLPLPVGFAVTTDVFPAGSKITVRTLEGDVDTASANNIYLMIGIEGEVYPILRETFEKNYLILDKTYSAASDYAPVVIDKLTGEKRSLLPFAGTCAPRESKLVRAASLSRDTKVFTNWDTERYYSGGPGDYLVANEGAFDDCYIVKERIFNASYTEV
ncbi:MAG: DHH family phosphoesterase [Oscillospiraceae bacterium]|jgi:phosphoglycolate phosphatase|nr:DHH family phosphoesterase [Oscillospiraceae bacterium]